MKFARMMAQRRGGDICYAFGDEARKFPSISLPILLLDRIFVADRTHKLPVGDPDEPKARADVERDVVFSFTLYQICISVLVRLYDVMLYQDAMYIYLHSCLELFIDLRSGHLAPA